MARPATGAPLWNPRTKTWEARVNIPGQGREPVPMPGIPACALGKPNAARCPCSSCQQAKRIARQLSEEYRDAGAVPANVGKVANEWYADYLDVHQSLGKSTIGHQGAWNRYVADIIGTIPLEQTKPAHYKTIRDRLTKLRLEGKIGAKRAMSVWGDQVKTPLSRAFSDDDPKYSSVRVGPANANPASGIKPPVSSEDLDEDERERQPLQPSEFLSLLALAKREDVSLSDLRRVAFLTYTGLSPSEFYGLRKNDVRLDDERPHLLVQQGRDMKTGDAKGTKTKQRKRRVPLHPNVRELVRVLLDTSTGELLFPVEGHVRTVEQFAPRLRELLTLAGIARPELLDGSDTLMPFDVRSLRTTFATWCAKAGYDSGWVRVWLGHKPQGVAEKNYVKDTPGFEDVVLKTPSPGVVPPFPPLPAALLRASGELVILDRRPNDSAFLQCEGRDLNPYRSYPTGT